MPKLILQAVVRIKRSNLYERIELIYMNFGFDSVRSSRIQ